MSDQDDVRVHQGKERCLGIIAIDGHGAGHAQMWKAGLDTIPLRLDDSSFKEKKIGKKLEKMAKEIEKKKLFDKDGLTINKLIISATEDSRSPLFNKLGLPALATQFITLPQGSTDPIQDTIQLSGHPTPSEGSLKKDRAKKADQSNTQNICTDRENSSVQKEKPQEMYLIIVINEVGTAYVQMYREGEKTEPSVFGDKDFMMKTNSGKLEWLVDWINKSNLFEKGREADYDLIISTTEYYQHHQMVFDGLDVKPKSTRFDKSLPRGSIAPIQDTLERLRITDEGFRAADQTQNISTSLTSTTTNASKEEFTMDEPEKEGDHVGSGENKEILKLLKAMNHKLDDQNQSIKKLELEVKQMRKDKEERPTNLTRNSSVKTKAPAAPRPSITDLQCHFHPAPVRVKHIQSQFSDKLTRMLSNERFQDDASGPTVVFCVNSSRILSDIQRDLKSGDAIADFKGPIFMVFIKPTNKPEEASERLDPSTWGYAKVKEAAFLLVDTNTRHLHECTTNEASLESVIKFLRK